jgi:hypothetical protein
MATRKRTVKKKAASSKKQPSSKKVVCFTIMPFGGWMDDYYETIFCPAIEAAGLEPHRADDLYRPSTIVHDIWEYTKKAEIVLADLTGKNPNVLYELGLAHAIAKPAILVTETLDDVPFDLRALRIIEYDKNAPDWGNILREGIQKAIQEVLESPLKSVLPAFLEVEGARHRESVSPREKEIIEMRQELDLIKRELRSRAESVEGPARTRRPHIQQNEAEKLVAQLVAEDISESIIEDVLTHQGAPPSWVKSEIEDARRKLKRSAKKEKAQQ